MLRYAEICLSRMEVPGESSICVYVTGCPNRCPSCHYPELCDPSLGDPLVAALPAIRRSVNLLCEACGEKLTDARGEAHHSFPASEAVAALVDEQLKACSLGYRGRYVHEAAVAVASGELDLGGLRRAGEDETIAALMKLPGVGVKVANCVSLFGLHHVNAFPIDVWVKRVLKEEYPHGYPFEEYAPYNGIYQQYVFAYYRNTHS